MQMRYIVLALAAVVSTAAHCAEPAPGTLIDDMEGVYKRQFKNGIVTGPNTPDEAYVSEDIVEIVRYDASHIYFRSVLQFYNGHSCDVSGIAAYEKGAFVYHDKTDTGLNGPACTVKISTDSQKLNLTDRISSDAPASCSYYCGARGSLSDYTIAKSTKRPIRYLPRLKSSQEFKKAVEDFSQPSASAVAPSR